MEEERKALEKRDYDHFQQILTDKQPLLERLENHAHTRRELVQAAGFSDEPSTLSAADRQAPAVARVWRQLGEQWQTCQELNAVNERIAQRTRLVVGQILDLLRGTAGDTKLYDSKGGTRHAGGGHKITNA